MKVLLVCEYREGSFLETVYELNSFADKIKAQKVWFAVGSKGNLPEVDGKFYIADVDKYKEYNPEIHKKLIIDVAKKEGIDYVVLPHTSYGWDLSPRVAAGLKVAQISEVIDISDDGFVVPACNQAKDKASCYHHSNWSICATQRWKKYRAAGSKFRR